jgi:hypothetical protein
VTGILTDTRAVSVLLHRHGALAFWDCAAAAPYVDVAMAPHRPAPDGDTSEATSTTRTRCSSRPTSSSGGRARRGC